MNIRLSAKTLLFPGMNLHARLRYRFVPRNFNWSGRNSKVLDVGCGNGMLSYAAWQKGAIVRGITVKESEVAGCQELFNEKKGIPETELRFEKKSMQDMRQENLSYDAVICADVLEHIMDDEGACRTLGRLLRPGGCIHLTVPNAGHPYNISFPLDREEKGGHVRPGYTAEGIRELFDPLGLVVEKVTGFGGPIRQAFNHRIKETQEKFGPASGLPLFFLSLPFLFLDTTNPKVPFSFYMRACKPYSSDS